MIRNAVGGGGVSAFTEKSVAKMYGSTLLALRGGGWGVKFPGKKCTQHFNGPLVLWSGL